MVKKKETVSKEAPAPQPETEKPNPMTNPEAPQPTVEAPNPPAQPETPVTENPNPAPETSATPNGPVVDATAELAQSIVDSKPKAEPEAVAAAAEKKKRGRPPGSPTKNQSGIVTPKKKEVPTWPDGRPIDFEMCEAAAEQTTHSSLLVLATLAGDGSIVKGQTKEAKEQEEIIVQGWKRYYEKFGIKESDPRVSIFMGYLALASVHLQKPKTRKQVVKRAKSFWGQAKLAYGAVKEKIRAWREG